MSIDIIRQQFPDLSSPALEKLERLHRLLREWNEKLNLVSRKDVEHLVDHHLLHALAPLRYFTLAQGTRLLDVGTGGGLPGLPLAIVYPQAQFHLVDSVGKKVKAVQAMIEELQLDNAAAVHKRAEALESKWDFVLGRAVTALPTFLGWIAKNLKPGGPSSHPHGVLYFKGSLYAEELQGAGLKPLRVYDLERTFPGVPYYHEKYLVYLKATAVQAQFLKKRQRG